MEVNGKPNGSAGPAGIRNSIEKAAGSASTAAHNAIDRLADGARPAVDRIASGAHHTVDRLSGAATSAAGKIEQRTTQINEASQQLVEGCRTYVKGNPMKSLGIAVAAGFVLSRLFKLR